jgi:hypothetical protein
VAVRPEDNRAAFVHGVDKKVRIARSTLKQGKHTPAELLLFREKFPDPDYSKNDTSCP